MSQQDPIEAARRREEFLRPVSAPEGVDPVREALERIVDRADLAINRFTQGDDLDAILAKDEGLYEIVRIATDALALPRPDRLSEEERRLREVLLRTEDCHAAIARHAAAEAEVSALRAALEAAETDAQLCRERLGDERERRRAAEARAVPEGDDGYTCEWDCCP